MTSRNQSLDVLRGVAVLLVTVCHYSVVAGDEPLLRVGEVGVDLFFVLSGFLISGLLFSEFKETGDIALKRFWIRRGFKIYPSFYAFTALTSFLIISRSHRVPRELFGEAVFLQNYLPHVWPHTWSLAVEEHFYLTLPLALIALVRLRKYTVNPFRLIPLISVAVSALCLYLRIKAFHHGADWDHVAFPTHMRIDGLFAGVTLGYFYHFDRQSFVEAKSKLFLFIGLFFAAGLLIIPSVGQISIAYIAFSFIFAWMMNNPSSKQWPTSKALAWIGYYSYSIYVWHAMVMFAIRYVSATWYRFPLYMISVVGLGIVMSKIIEMPSLRLRDKWFPSTRQQSRNCSLPALADSSDSARTAAPARAGIEHLLQPAD